MCVIPIGSLHGVVNCLIINDFLWKGWNKLKQSTFCAPVIQGGLNMIHVKNTVHRLQAKWMEHLCKDVGSSWSWFIWPKIEEIIPFGMLPGVCSISDHLISHLPPFYYAMIHSFAYVNNLFFKANQSEHLLHNIWFSPMFPYLDRLWADRGFNTLVDIPLIDGKLMFIVF